MDIINDSPTEEQTQQVHVKFVLEPVRIAVNATLTEILKINNNNNEISIKMIIDQISRNSDRIDIDVLFKGSLSELKY